MLESSLNVIRELLHRGAEVNSHDKRNVTCLMLATLSGRSEVVGVLINGGADPQRRDIYNNTALDMAKNTPVKYCKD